MASLNWIVGIAFTGAVGVLGTMMLLFLKGLRADIKDLSIKFAADLSALNKDLTQVRIDQAKMQEQIYTLLRGAGDGKIVERGSL